MYYDKRDQFLEDAIVDDRMQESGLGQVFFPSSRTELYNPFTGGTFTPGQNALSPENRPFSALPGGWKGAGAASYADYVARAKQAQQEKLSAQTPQMNQLQKVLADRARADAEEKIRKATSAAEKQAAITQPAKIEDPLMKLLGKPTGVATPKSTVKTVPIEDEEPSGYKTSSSFVPSGTTTPTRMVSSGGVAIIPRPIAKTATQPSDQYDYSDLIIQARTPVQTPQPVVPARPQKQVSKSGRSIQEIIADVMGKVTPPSAGISPPLKPPDQPSIPVVGIAPESVIPPTGPIVSVASGVLAPMIAVADVSSYGAKYASETAAHKPSKPSVSEWPTWMIKTGEFVSKTADVVKTTTEKVGEGVSAVGKQIVKGVVIADKKLSKANEFGKYIPKANQEVLNVKVRDVDEKDLSLSEDRAYREAQRLGKEALLKLQAIKEFFRLRVKNPSEAAHMESVTGSSTWALATWEASQASKPGQSPADSVKAAQNLAPLLDNIRRFDAEKPSMTQEQKLNRDIQQVRDRMRSDPINASDYEEQIRAAQRELKQLQKKSSQPKLLVGVQIPELRAEVVDLPELRAEVVEIPESFNREELWLTEQMARGKDIDISARDYLAESGIAPTPQAIQELKERLSLLKSAMKPRSKPVVGLSL